MLILDLTRLLPGAIATKLLLDVGFEVIKVEEPGVGDYMREVAPELFRLLNSGKRSVAINLRREEGRRIFLRLVKDACAIVESFRPGVAEKLGIAYRDLVNVRPSIAYVAIRGYSKGPWRSLPGHDLNYMAVSGSLKDPRPYPLQIADIGAGIIAAFNVVVLTLKGGGYSEVSMADVATLFNIVNILGGAEVLNGDYPCYTVYRVKDGYIALAALEGKFWANFCKAIRREDLVERQFDKSALGDVAEELAKYTVSQLMELAHLHDLPLSPVSPFSKPLNEATSLPLRDLGPAPRRGEHTREVIGRIAEELGLDLDELVRTSVIEV